jgi:hypothetical protein
MTAPGEKPTALDNWTDQRSDSTGGRDTKMDRTIPRQAAIFPIAAALDKLPTDP